jgi:RES domain-containing protein
VWVIFALFAGGAAFGFADVSSLSTLGVDARRYGTFEYSLTQAIAAAAFFLDFDGLIVPSARSTELNLVIFTEKLEIGERLKVRASEPVDWSARADMRTLLVTSPER